MYVLNQFVVQTFLSKKKVDLCIYVDKTIVQIDGKMVEIIEVLCLVV